jgi:hypothetical protein
VTAQCTVSWQGMTGPRILRGFKASAVIDGHCSAMQKQPSLRNFDVDMATPSWLVMFC